MSNLKHDFDGQDAKPSIDNEDEVVYPEDYDDDDVKLAKLMRKAFRTKEEAQDALLQKEKPGLVL